MNMDSLEGSRPGASHMEPPEPSGGQQRGFRRISTIFENMLGEICDRFGSYSVLVGTFVRGTTGITKLIHTVEPIPSATVMGAKIGPIPTSKALDKTPGRFRPADFEF